MSSSEWDTGLCAALLCHESVLLVHDCVLLLNIDCALLLPAYDVGGDRIPEICEKSSSGSGGMGGAGGTSRPRVEVAKRRGDTGRDASCPQSPSEVALPAVEVAGPRGEVENPGGDVARPEGDGVCADDEVACVARCTR